MDGLIQKLVRKQHGVVTTEQALAAGMTTASLRHRIDSKRWVRATHGVYVVVAVANPSAWETRAMVACLYGGPSTRLALGSAAYLWRLDGFLTAPKVIDIIRPHGTAATIDGVRVTAVRGLTDRNVRRRNKIPCTGLPRTLIDLARKLDEAALEIALDSALRENPWWRAETLKQIKQSGSRGRKGVPRLVRLLEERSDHRDSALEVLVDRCCFAAGVPRPTKQFTIIENGERIVRADFAWPGIKVAILAQGYRYHHGREAFEKDSRQLSQLGKCGWLVLTPTWREIHRQPARFIEDIRHTHEEGTRRWPTAA